MPGPDTTHLIFTTWVFDPVAAGTIFAAACFYLAGVRVMHRRGDGWPIGRTISFCLFGLGSAVIATQASPAAFDKTVLSMHMVQHMILSMITPVFLALGAPVTLALRTLSRTPRRWLLAVLHSRVAQVLSFPPLAFVLYVFSPWALYFSGWYPATLTNDYLHAVLHLHFVAVGCLFFWPILGIDPVPGRMRYPFRLLAIVLTLPFHAYLGVTIMSRTTLIAGDFYSRIPMPWDATRMADQNLAGSLLWASGDAVGMVFFAALFVQWVRYSQREAIREDRRLDMLEAQARRESAAG